MKTQKTRNAWKSIVAGALSLAASVLPLTARAGVISKPYVQTTFSSGYVSTSGSAVKEACRQDWASVNVKDLTFGIFQNQFFGEKGISERDYCASYSFPVSSNLTGNVGFQYWDYPNGRFGRFDSAEIAELNYSGAVKASLNYTHVNRNDATENGERVYLKVSKPFKLADGKTKVELTPSLAAAWLDSFYGVSGLSQASAGLDLTVSRGNFNVCLSGTAQKSLDSDVESLNWGKQA